jgi:hypothetical protein
MPVAVGPITNATPVSVGADLGGGRALEITSTPGLMASALLG